ncbi:tail fiber assembly protein, partial [Xenorhabdus sp. XENO-10]
RKQHLMNEARDRIAPLQDAADLGIATDTEKSVLTAWRKYRVLLNRVDCSTAPDVKWPEQPQ